MEKLKEHLGESANMLKSAITGSAAGGSGSESVVYGGQVKITTAGREEHTAATDTVWLAMHVNNNNNSLEVQGCDDDVFAAAEQQLQQKQQQQAEQQQLQNQQKQSAEQLNAQNRWKKRVAKPLRAFCEAVGVSSKHKCNNAVAEGIYTGVTAGCPVGNSTVEDDGRVGIGVESDDTATTIREQEQKQMAKQNGASTPNSGSRPDIRHADTITTTHASTTTVHALPTSTAVSIGDATAAAVALSAQDYVDEANAAFAAGAGAVSLTPPDNSHSNRTSMNNSTENLSYSSDNFYPDDLILLGDDDDIEAEEISLNSDDCIYAYRGDGADFDSAFDAFRGCVAGKDTMGMGDDETDFLEMDFEPDPLSEIEYGFVGMSVAPSQEAHSNAFLLQRNSCHLSERHSAGMGHHTPVTQRQLFSSPIDNMPPTAAVAPKAALQSQALLNKDFARITLHLDQIKGELSDYDCVGKTRNERLSTLGVDDLSDSVDVAKLPTLTTNTPAAHSLPSTLHAHFGRDVPEQQETRAITDSKMTGAKPKRLSTFSTSSSTSSKNSSKSRTSLRSTYAAMPLCNSSSFDERSVSCAEFRCTSVTAAPVPDECSPNVASVAGTASAVCDDFNVNDETCLDCLEKEFLANTIGKALEPYVCPKCRRRSGCGLGRGNSHSGSRTFYSRPAEHSRCRSGSPSFFLELREHGLYDTANDLLQGHVQRNKRSKDNWSDNASAKSKNSCADNASSSGNDSGGAGVAVGGANMLYMHDSSLVAQQTGAIQKRPTCDSFKSEQLQNMLLTEPEILTVSTVNLTEDSLVQALDKLHVPYNAERLKSYFRSNSPNSSLHATTSPAKYFKSLKHFLLHESKKHGNHAKLKCLIELATRQQVIVQFKKDTSITNMEMITIKVADIIQVWAHSKDLASLKTLDKRFIETNVLGKIANILRQAQQQRSARRPLPEFISIPRYYASGYLTLTKKC